MLKFNQFIIVTLLSLTSLYAQVPGYLGKKFSLGATIATNFGSSGPTADNKGGNYYGDAGGGWAPDLKFGGQLNYVVGRRKELTLSAEYFKTGMVNTYTTPTVSTRPTFDVDEHYCFHNLEVTSLSLGLRFYGGQTLAPMGFSYEANLGYQMISGQIIDKRTTYGLYSNRTHQPISINQNKGLLIAGVGLNWNTILFDRMVLNFGVKSQFPMTWLTKLIVRIESYGGEVTNQDAFDTAFESRLNNINLFMVQAGVSYLLF